MASLNKNITIKEYQKFIEEVYGLPNDRHFSAWDMLTNIERFITRSLKGIRKVDSEKTKLNLIISLSWFMSLINQLHIDLEKEIWKRFPYACSYCGDCPCSCKERKIKKRQKIKINQTDKPEKLSDFQKMFEKIYPSKKRTLVDAGIHLAEEIGELAEAILAYRGSHRKEDFNNIKTETADLFSCVTGVFNSMKISVAEEASVIFSKNCHICKKAPCQCDFSHIVRFKS